MDGKVSEWSGQASDGGGGDGGDNDKSRRRPVPREMIYLGSREWGMEVACSLPTLPGEEKKEEEAAEAEEAIPGRGRVRSSSPGRDPRLIGGEGRDESGRPQTPSSPPNRLLFFPAALLPFSLTYFLACHSIGYCVDALVHRSMQSTSMFLRARRHRCCIALLRNT